MFYFKTAKASQTVNVNEQDYFDRTPLHYAVLYNRLQTAEVYAISFYMYMCNVEFLTKYKYKCG